MFKTQKNCNRYKYNHNYYDYFYGKICFFFVVHKYSEYTGFVGCLLECLEWYKSVIKMYCFQLYEKYALNRYAGIFVLCLSRQTLLSCTSLRSILTVISSK